MTGGRPSAKGRDVGQRREAKTSHDRCCSGNAITQAPCRALASVAGLTWGRHEAEEVQKAREPTALFKVVPELSSRRAESRMEGQGSWLHGGVGSGRGLCSHDCQLRLPLPPVAHTWLLCLLFPVSLPPRASRVCFWISRDRAIVAADARCSRDRRQVHAVVGTECMCTNERGGEVGGSCNVKYLPRALQPDKPQSPPSPSTPLRAGFLLFMSRMTIRMGHGRPKTFSRDVGDQPELQTATNNPRPEMA